MASLRRSSRPIRDVLNVGRSKGPTCDRHGPWAALVRAYRERSDGETHERSVSAAVFRRDRSAEEISREWRNEIALSLRE